MMNQSAAYDDIAPYYASFVEEHLADEASVLATATRSLLKIVGDATGLTVCDLGCGEGHVSRRLAQSATGVVGIDISLALLATAHDKSMANNIQFVADDAQTLSTQPNESFDCVVSNLALMDMPNLEAVYQSVARVLRGGGRFVFSITHPCFQTPNSNVLVDNGGHYIGRRVSEYAQEGFWRSTNPNGIRGQVGAYHRMLSTYMNIAARTGFVLQQIVEPVLLELESAEPYIVSQQEIPLVMVIDLQKQAPLPSTNSDQEVFIARNIHV